MGMLLASAISYAEVTPQRQAELIHLLKHDCGSCHGMMLKGGLGPALVPEALTGKSADYLFQTVRDGRPGTPMPSWRSVLTEVEMRYLVKLLRNGVTE